MKKAQLEPQFENTIYEAIWVKLSRRRKERGRENEITNDYDLWLELLLWAEQSFISSRFNKTFHSVWYFNFVLLLTKAASAYSGVIGRQQCEISSSKVRRKKRLFVLNFFFAIFASSENIYSTICNPPHKLDVDCFGKLNRINCVRFFSQSSTRREEQQTKWRNSLSQWNLHKIRRNDTIDWELLGLGRSFLKHWVFGAAH